MNYSVFLRSHFWRKVSKKLGFWKIPQLFLPKFGDNLDIKSDKNKLKCEVKSGAKNDHFWEAF